MYVAVGLPMSLYVCRNELGAYVLSVMLTGILAGILGILSWRDMIDFGLGDVKGVMSLSLVIPIQQSYAIPFAIGSLINALLISGIIIIVILFKNLLDPEVSIRDPRILKGYRIEASKISERVEVLEPTQKDSKVWVSPRIPFMIPFTLGILIEFFIGDIFLKLVYFLLSL